jgi:WD40 repeat protein
LDHLTAHTDDIRCVAWIPASESNHSSELLVTGGDDQKLRVWEVNSTGAVLINTLGSIRGRIYKLAWSAAQGLLASVSGDGIIRLWPVNVLTTEQHCHANPGNNNALCCDGDGLGCNGRYWASWKDAGMTRAYQVHAVSWVGDTNVLATAWADGAVRLLSYSSGAAPPLTLESTLPSNGRLYSITWLSTPEYMAWASPDHPHPELWGLNDTAASVVLSRGLADGGYGLCPYAHCNGVPISAADSTGSLLATGSIDSTVKIWDTSTGEKSMTLDGHSSHVLALVWLDTEGQVASGGKDGDISLWDPTNTASTSAVETISAAHAGEVRALAWVETLGILASGGTDDSLNLWTCV